MRNFRSKAKKTMACILATLVLTTCYVTLPAVTGGVGLSSVNAEETQPSDFTYKTYPGDVVEITGYKGSATEITIPSEINGKTVTSIDASRYGRGAFEGLDNLKNVTIPDSVRYIGSHTFENCTSLQSVTIPNSVTSICDGTFYNCTNLTSVTIPNSITSIGGDAFFGCTSLKNITIPNKVTEIKAQTFFGCTSLTSVTIPNSVTTINYNAFNSCESLTSIEIPNSITSIEAGAFVRCINLTSIKVDEDNLYYSSQDGVLFNKDKTELITYPANKKDTSYTIPNGVKSTAPFAFNSCVHLECITIPDSVTAIGNPEFLDAAGLIFLNCYSLTTFIVSDDNTVYSSQDGVLFSKDKTVLIRYPDSKKDTTYTVPNGVTKFQRGAFNNKLLFGQVIHTNLTSITIPKSLKVIECRATDDFKDVYYTGTEDEWGKIDIEEHNPILNSKIHYNSSGVGNGLKLYSDYTELSTKIGEEIKIGVAIYKNNKQQTDVSGITYVIEDPDILSVVKSSVVDNCSFITVKAKKAGTTYVSFTDSSTGYYTRVPVTVCDTGKLVCAARNVPVDVDVPEKGNTNFYNVNGIYVSDYTYRDDSNGDCIVSFNVYNTRATYGAVEVYDENCNMIDVAIINKLPTSPTSIKETLWDNTCHLVSDIYHGTLLSYKQQSNFSKKTPIKDLRIPDGGYIKITNDTSKSFVVAFVNAIDIGISTHSALKAGIDFGNSNSYEFAKKLTTKMIKDEVYLKIVSDYIKDPEIYTNKILENIGKKIAFDGKSLGQFGSTVLSNINELDSDFAKLILDTGVDIGIDAAEDVFEELSGPFGVLLKGAFLSAKFGNIICQATAYVASYDVGDIAILNQGGAVRSYSGIKVESQTSFDSNLVLKTFSIFDDKKYTDILNKSFPDYKGLRTYNIAMIKNGKEVEPNQEVTVTIPIPKDLKDIAASLKVIRINDNGTVTDMNAKTQDNCLIFTTNHFSIYMLVSAPKQPVKPSDVSNEPSKSTETSQKNSTDNSIDNASGKTSESINTSDNNDIGGIALVAVLSLIIGISVIIAKKEKLRCRNLRK